MGIGKLIEEVGGAVVAEQAAEAVDPNAGVLVKGAAAVAGTRRRGKAVRWAASPRRRQGGKSRTRP